MLAVAVVKQVQRFQATDEQAYLEKTMGPFLRWINPYIDGSSFHSRYKALVAMALADPAAVSHWSALHHHGLTEQGPRKVFVLTTTGSTIPRTRDKGVRPTRDGYPVGDTLYQFVQVKPERFFGVEKVWLGEAQVTITDPERTLLGGLSMPHYCGDIAEVKHLPFFPFGDDIGGKRTPYLRRDSEDILHTEGGLGF